MAIALNARSWNGDGDDDQDAGGCGWTRGTGARTRTRTGTHARVHTCKNMSIGRNVHKGGARSAQYEREAREARPQAIPDVPTNPGLAGPLKARSVMGGSPYDVRQASTTYIQYSQPSALVHIALMPSSEASLKA